jgi:hypothetical protein
MEAAARALAISSCGGSSAEAGVDMSLLSSIIRRRRGELLGGDTGIALISSAELAMGAQGIVNPARLSEIYAPGFSKL